MSLERMINEAVRCALCGGKLGCGCWVTCWCCGWHYQKGQRCPQGCLVLRCACAAPEESRRACATGGGNRTPCRCACHKVEPKLPTQQRHGHRPV